MSQKRFGGRGEQSHGERQQPSAKTEFKIGQSVTSIAEQKDRPMDDQGNPLFVNIDVDGIRFIDRHSIPLAILGYLLLDCLQYPDEQRPLIAAVMSNPELSRTNYIEIAGKRLFFYEIVNGLKNDLSIWPDNAGIVFAIDKSSLCALIAMRRGSLLRLIGEVKPALRGTHPYLGTARTSGNHAPMSALPGHLGLSGWPGVSGRSGQPRLIGIRAFRISKISCPFARTVARRASSSRAQ